MKNVLALIGSLSAKSSNKTIVEHIGHLTAGKLDIEIYDGIRDLPQFNPDLEKEAPPPIVAEFRRLVREVDAVLISTPEYIFGVPGALKNALDWTVSTADFREKPVALIVASLSGEKAFESLSLTLQTIEAIIADGSSLLISHIKAKISPDGKINHEQTLTGIKALTDSFIAALKA